MYDDNDVNDVNDVNDTMTGGTGNRTAGDSSPCDGVCGCLQISFGDRDALVTVSGRTGTLTFTAPEWDAFVAGGKGGEFNRRH